MAAAAPAVVPHNLEAEQAVLGAVLVDNARLRLAAAHVGPESFFRHAHARIWLALADLIDAGTVADPITVVDALRQRGQLEDVGGPAYIAALPDHGRGTNVEHYAKRVADHCRARQAIAALQRGLDRLYTDGATDDVITELVAHVEQAKPRETRGEAGPLFESARDTCQATDRVSLLLDPYLPAGAVVSVIGKIKDGKTSTILELVRCLRRQQPFCGFAAPGSVSRVLFATEQPRSSFAKQLRDAGLHDDEGVVVTYLSAWKGRPWGSVGPALVQHALAACCDALVLDTASRWFGFKGDEENHSGGAEHVDAFLPYTAAGGTVILSRHGRKSGGSASDAGRGSSAIEGAADAILHLTRPSGHGADVRQIDYVGRFEAPDRLLLRRLPQATPDGPRYTFARVHDGGDGPSLPAQIRAALLGGFKTAAQLCEITEASHTSLVRCIKGMGDVVITGKGGAKGNAPLYGIRSHQPEPTNPTSPPLGFDVVGLVEGGKELTQPTQTHRVGELVQLKDRGIA